MARHLNDETAEFKMPRPGKHAAEDDDLETAEEPEATQRFDPGFRERPKPAPPAPQDRDR